MAFSVRIDVYKSSSEPAVLYVEPRCWDEKELRNDPRFKNTNDTGSYDDYTAELTKDEFIELHERYRPKDSGFWSHHTDIPPILERIDSLLEKPESERLKYVVTVFEWESGY